MRCRIRESEKKRTRRIRMDRKSEGFSFWAVGGKRGPEKSNSELKKGDIPEVDF